MKKIVIIFILFHFTIYFACNKSEIDTLAEKINFSYTVYNNCEIVPVVDQGDVYYSLAFKNKDGVEYRISAWDKDFYPPLNVSNRDDAKLALYMITSSMIGNISQDDDINHSVEFYDDDILKKTNSDFALATITAGNSDFSKGYKYVIINTYYKKDYGLIATFILINDIKDYYKKNCHAVCDDSYNLIRFK